jgi:hypothetical protein
MGWGEAIKSAFKPYPSGLNTSPLALPNGNGSNWAVTFDVVTRKPRIINQDALRKHRIFRDMASKRLVGEYAELKCCSQRFSFRIVYCKEYRPPRDCGRNAATAVPPPKIPPKSVGILEPSVLNQGQRLVATNATQLQFIGASFGILSGTIHGLPLTCHGSTESLWTHIRTLWIRFRCGMHPSNGSTCATGTEALALDLYPMIVVPSDLICPKKAVFRSYGSK